MPAFPDFPMPGGVHPIPGEPLRFHVQSRSDCRVSHLVDLQECGFNGACGCHDFQMRHLPKLKEDRREGRAMRKRRCWHIRQALYYFAELAARLTVKSAARRAA
jgi:hypothetical protein